MLKLTDISLKANKTKNVEVRIRENVSNDFIGKDNLSMYFEDNVEDVYKFFNGLFRIVWKDFNPKEANNFSSDYNEYYDKELDNNGYLAFHKTKCLTFYRPMPDNNRLYIFNKRRAESFIYDFEKYYNLK